MNTSATASSKISVFSLVYTAREHSLCQIESRLIMQPDAIDLLLAKAHLLTELGRVEEAKSTYLKAVTLAPTHFNALNNFGKLLFDNGYMSAARTVFKQAIEHHPCNSTSYTNLANVFYKFQELDAARQYYEKALELDPNQIEAHRGLSYVSREIGNEEAAKMHRRLGFQDRCVVSLPYRGKGEPVTVLQLISASGGNIPIEKYLDDGIFLNTIIATEYFDANQSLPIHKFIINAIADADLSMEALDAAERILSKTSAPVINYPKSVMVTTRAATAFRLASIPGVITPKTLSFSRELLARDDAKEMLGEHGFTYPLLLRSPGFHTGQYFIRVETPDQFAQATLSLPGKELMVIQYLDARSDDGKIRKYRVMMINGELYPLHLAISHEWKIHYFSAEMADNPEHRAEDAAFLNNMPGVLGAKAMKALGGIQATLGLDYAGVDFGLNSQGAILLFEANAAMTVIPPGLDDRWDYRRPHVQKIIDATRKMLIDKTESDSV